jgi:hypothetical protein
MATKYLVTIQLRDGDTTRFRSVLTTEKVDVRDVEYYYHTLMGFKTYELIVRNMEVPESFTLSLIGGHANEIPQHFPSHDHEIQGEEGIARYYGLIDRVLEMEKMRLECGLSGQIGHQQQSAQSHRTNRSKYMTWIQEMLEKFKNTEATQSDVGEIEDNETLAWIFTPVLSDIRETRGSRVITNTGIGRQWSALIGTELYPDFVIRRRLSAVDWNFQHPSSVRLAKTAIEWYVDAQLMGEWEGDGVSPWIMNADEDLMAVLAPFRSVGPRQSFPSMGGDEPKKEKVHPLMHILRRLEGDVFVSQLSCECPLIALTQQMWEKFLRHIFRTYGIGTDVVDSCWGPVEELIHIWVRGKFGVRMDKPAVISAWQPLWDVLMTTEQEQTPERFSILLMTLDVFDPITSITMSNTEKMEVSRVWLKIYVEKDMVREADAKVQATHFYSSARDWCLKYTPIRVMDNMFKPATMGPIMTMMGHPCHKTKKGRMLIGIRYKIPPQGLVPEPPAPKETGPSVLSYMMSEEKPDGIQIHAKDEIHLGTL